MFKGQKEGHASSNSELQETAYEKSLGEGRDNNWANHIGSCRVR